MAMTDAHMRDNIPGEDISGRNSTDSNQSDERLVGSNEPKTDKTFWQSVKTAFLKAFDEIYPPDGMDVVNKVHNNIKIFNAKNNQKSSLRSLEKYRTHWGTRLASFMGLPTRRLNNNEPNHLSVPNDEQSVANLAYNFLGWRDKTARWKNGLRSVLMVPLNVIIMLLRLPLNIIKVATELLPSFLNRFFTVCGNHAKKAASLADKENRSAAFWGYRFLWLVAQPFRGASFLLHYMGEALTSPIEHFRKAIKVKKSRKDGMGWYVGKKIFHGGLAIASSVAMYILAAPAAAFILKTYVAPLVVHHLPPFMVNAYTWVADKIGPAITKFGSWLVENPAVAWVTHHVGLGTVYSTTTAAASLGAAFAVGITTLGTGINRLFENYFKPWWHKPSAADLRDGHDLDDVYVKNLFTSSKSASDIMPGRAPLSPSGNVPPYIAAESVYVPTSATQQSVKAQRPAADKLGDWQAAKLAAGHTPSLSQNRNGLLTGTASNTERADVTPDKSSDAQKILRPGQRVLS